MSKFQEPFYPEEFDDLGPSYDSEDIGCACNDEGLDSDWQWNVEQQCYICSGCGEVQ